MFARVKKTGSYQYLQIVENNKIDGKVKQRVIATLGRLDELQEKGRIDALIKSLSRYSEAIHLMLLDQSTPDAEVLKTGPVLIFERLWKETGIKDAISGLLAKRKFEFDVERALFLTVFHRLMVSGSDRFCERWRSDYAINGSENLELHHLYRAMAFLGEALPKTELSEEDEFALSPRCIKDLIEEDIFFRRRDLFTSLDLVFFDTTSIYFEGEGGETLGQKGFSKDHRPDLNQMVVGAVIDDKGNPICCEMWPGNTSDVKTLKAVLERMRERFDIKRFCIVADRGMMSADNIRFIEDPAHDLFYILGSRMRREKEVREQILTCGGRYRVVHEENDKTHGPSPLKVKEIFHNGSRYIVCLNVRQARKEARDRVSIINDLKEKIKQGAKQLIGNKGYRKYLKVDKESVSIDFSKAGKEAKYDGRWVLKTNTSLTPDQVALKYKDLWQVERLFRDIKSLLETRPVFHRRDDTIRGHVFCSFLALILRKELDTRLKKAGFSLEWTRIKQDLKSLQEIKLEENGKRIVIRTQGKGDCGKIFKAVGVAMPPTIKIL